MNDEKSEKDICFRLGSKTSVGTIVWGKLGSYHWWPAIIIKSSDCGQPEAKFGNLWLFWFGDHKISEVSRKRIVEFTSHFSRMFVGVSGKYLQKAVFEALEILAGRCNYNFENAEDLISWAKEEFKSSDTALISSTDMPPFVLKHLEYLQKKPSSKAFERDDAVRESDLAEKIFNTSVPLKNIREGLVKIQDICIACCESELQLVAEHPLFDGSLCFQCKVRLQENMYAYGNDGKSLCCIICAKPGSLILCDDKNCHRSFCIHCITLFLGPDEKKKIVETDPWYCFFCCNNGCGLLQIKRDWEDRIMDFFQPSKVHVQELPMQNFAPKKPIKVLSLFDGIGTGKFVLDSLGFEVDVYYASEIDEDAMNVSKLNHMNSISYVGDVTQLTEERIQLLGPIDLVIGGSPCNDLSLVNPFRKGIYDNAGSWYISPKVPWSNLRRNQFSIN